MYTFHKTVYKRSFSNTALLNYFQQYVRLILELISQNYCTDHETISDVKKAQILVG